MCSSTLKNTKYCLSPPQPFPDSANKVRHQEETGLLEQSRWEGEGPAGTMQEAPRRAWALQLSVMLLGHCLCCAGPVVATAQLAAAITQCHNQNCNCKKSGFFLDLFFVVVGWVFLFCLFGVFLQRFVWLFSGQEGRMLLLSRNKMSSSYSCSCRSSVWWCFVYLPCEDCEKGTKNTRQALL